MQTATASSLHAYRAVPGTPGQRTIRPWIRNLFCAVQHPCGVSTDVGAVWQEASDATRLLQTDRVAVVDAEPMAAEGMNAAVDRKPALEFLEVELSPGDVAPPAQRVDDTVRSGPGCGRGCAAAGIAVIKGSQ